MKRACSQNSNSNEFESSENLPRKNKFMRVSSDNSKSNFPRMKRKKLLYDLLTQSFLYRKEYPARTTH